MINNSIVDGKYGDVIYTLRTANLERSHPFTIEPIRVGFNEINKYTISGITCYNVLCSQQITFTFNSEMSNTS